MFKDTHAYSGFAVDDVDRAREFYGETLGIETEVLDAENGLIQLDIAGDRPTLVYAKPDFTPATYTILNFPVPGRGGHRRRARRARGELRALRRFRPGRQGHRPRSRADDRVVPRPRGQHPLRPLEQQ